MEQPLEDLVSRIGEATLATTETVDALAERLDGLAHQVQQQGYQIFALSDAIQNLMQLQDASLQRMEHLIQMLERVAIALESQNSNTHN